MLLRARYLVDIVGYNQVRGLPLKAAELADAIGELVAKAEGVPVDLSTTSTNGSPAASREAIT
jgi:2-oxoglutarate ferredoxin oxidoreductase subunit alpha